jgi:LDH2 family malate/lactate/ureidoglycolate dehydrogenase
MRGSAPAVADTPLLVPGELEARLEDGHRRDGIPLSEETLSGLAQAARDLGLDPKMHLPEASNCAPSRAGSPP